MKIITRGVIPGERIHRATCYNCKSELEFQECEGKVTHDQRDGDFITVVCPVCNVTVTADLHSNRNQR